MKSRERVSMTGVLYFGITSLGPVRENDAERGADSIGIVGALDASSVGLDDGPAEAQSNAEAIGLGGEEG